MSAAVSISLFIHGKTADAPAILSLGDKEASVMHELDAPSHTVLKEALSRAYLRGICNVIVIPEIIVPVSRNIRLGYAKIRAALHVMSVLFAHNLCLLNLRHLPFSSILTHF